ncbi:hypothetical protein [Deinococcus multiflagellatus]|uniref:Uncharacterized protein n=1 Tax=Deinococcus multiflagellatus TaxID=1656887 RepID=A0ABW1ZK22_9DEIO|nr:hypothetical protein [Deinococcus multiflagellatus]MBZ9712523.1 hypothetical protein [Deinococcus multiflagellatus]
MLLTILLLLMALGGVALLLSGVTRGQSRYSAIPQGHARRDSAQDVFWEARVLAALHGNRAALERHVLSKQRSHPGLKRWQLLRLVDLDLAKKAGKGRHVPRPAVFRTHF